MMLDHRWQQTVFFFESIIIQLIRSTTLIHSGMKVTEQVFESFIQLICLKSQIHSGTKWHYGVPRDITKLCLELGFAA